MTLKQPIISASRRCDIPAYYSDWFKQRLKAGFASYLNPFNQKKHTVSLTPENVAAFVFWSKNPSPFFPIIKTITTDYCFYFHLTLNPYPPLLEKNMLPLSKRIDIFKKLSDLTSPAQTIWRYDPILLTDQMDHHFHLKAFESIAKQLSGYTTKCFISFVNLYKKTESNLKKTGIQLQETNLNHHLTLTTKLLEMASSYNINLYSCCNDYLRLSGIQKGHCIDTQILKEIYPDHSFEAKKAPTRKECGCVKAIDIGRYNTCPAGCVYCYANLNQKLALKNFKTHDPTNEAL